MNNTEATTIVAIVRNLCPSQKFDELTPAVWAGVLEDISESDAKAAIKNLGRRLRYISPSDIIEEVAVIRSKRLKNAEESFVYSNWYPKHLPGESDASHARREIEAKRAYFKAVADGEPEPEVPELPQVSQREQVMVGVLRQLERGHGG